MAGRRTKTTTLILALLGITGCTIKPPPKLARDQALPLSSPPPIPQRVDSDAVLPWAREEPVFLIVDRMCRQLHVYRYGRLTKTYPVVLGRNPGRKLYAGDRRTPIGLYMISGKAPHRKWENFMLLDYPTEYDVHRYWQHVAFGQVPKRGEGYPGVGSEIGIHGTDKETFNQLGINWTLGCISLFNHHMRELYKIAAVGTLVYIKD
jgi:murein L,D-transpeptidase YafK